VARNLHAKFGMNGTVPEFFTIFSSSKHHLKQPFGVDRTVSEFPTIFFKQKPPFRAAVTSLSVT
jgi:hypothetical protein